MSKSWFEGEEDDLNSALVPETRTGGKCLTASYSKPGLGREIIGTERDLVLMCCKIMIEAG